MTEIIIGFVLFIIGYVFCRRANFVLGGLLL